MSGKDGTETAGERGGAGQPVVSPASRQRFPAPVPHLGNTVSPLLGGRDTGGRLALLHSVERRGCEPPSHRHRHEDEVVYVLEGVVTFYVDGEPCRLAAGGCLFLPREGEHGYAVESAEARLLTVVMPAGLEGYYLELGDTSGEADGNGQEQPDIERLVTVAARYGCEITGPAPTAESGTARD